MNEHGIIMQTIPGDSFLLFRAILDVAVKQPKFHRALVIPAPVHPNSFAMEGGNAGIQGLVRYRNVCKPWLEFEPYPRLNPCVRIPEIPIGKLFTAK